MLTNETTNGASETTGASRLPKQKKEKKGKPASAASASFSLLGARDNVVNDKRYSDKTESSARLATLADSAGTKLRTALDGRYTGDARAVIASLKVKAGKSKLQTVVSKCLTHIDDAPNEAVATVFERAAQGGCVV